MSITIKIDTNAKEAVRWLERVYRDQVPFASAVALTRTAKEARDAARSELDAHFKIRRRIVRSGIRHRGAQKRDWPRQFSQVGTIDQFMAEHGTGATRRSRGRHRLRIPTSKIQRKKTGAIRKPQIIPRLLATKKAAIVKVRGKDVVVGAARSGRFKKGSGVLFFLRPSVKIKKDWPFVATVERVAQKELPRQYRNALAKAVKSRR